MYRQKDFDMIKLNLDIIEHNAEDEFVRNHKVPNLKEIDAINKIILKFIKDNKRIIYGGYAQNELIKKKNKDDAFYTETDMADIEFYTPEPIKDGLTLADMLHKEGYEHTQLKEGVHHETYNLFCNFRNYSDLSYMPKNVFNNCPTIDVDGLKMTHPHFMMIDAYRVYTDLLTSNFRLSKTFNRMTTLMKHYQYDDDAKHNIIKYNKTIKPKELDDIQKFIRQKIIHDSKLIVVGHYAFNYYAKKVDTKSVIEYFPYYQIITSEYEKDVKNIYDILKKEYGDKIKTREFYPYFQFFGKRIEYVYDNQVILKLYSNNNRCTPFKISDKKHTNFGTFQTLILYFLIDYSYAIINNFNHEETNYMGLIVKLFNLRDKYLKDRNLTVLDESPFVEFTLECIGKPFDMIRESLLEGKRRIKAGKKFKFEYFPKDTPGKVPEFRFDNTSGNLIKNEKDLTKLT